jgi:hypothetical protein
MSENNNGLEAYETLRRYLEENNWDAEEIPGKHAFKAHRTGDMFSSTYYFEIKVDLEQFLLYIVPDFIVPTNDLALVAEYVARVNSGMRIGNFEVDFRNGEIRFKSSINFKDEKLTPALIKGVVEPALDAYETYMPGLVNVIAGIESPVRALNKIDYGE